MPDRIQGSRFRIQGVWHVLRTAILSLVLMTLLVGVFYPMLVTGVAQMVFSAKASGNLVTKNNKIIGSELLGQEFTEDKYFWGRPSATTPPYNAAASGGSNLSPNNPKLKEAVKTRVMKLKHADPKNKSSIPVDLVTASASGLDPDISVAAAEYQVARVAAARGMKEEAVRMLIKAYAKKRLFGFIGEPRVNVLMLNMALDEGIRH